MAPPVKRHLFAGVRVSLARTSGGHRGEFGYRRAHIRRTIARVGGAKSFYRLLGLITLRNSPDEPTCSKMARFRSNPRASRGYPPNHVSVGSEKIAYRPQFRTSRPPIGRRETRLRAYRA